MPTFPGITVATLSENRGPWGREAPDTLPLRAPSADSLRGCPPSSVPSELTSEREPRAARTSAAEMTAPPPRGAVPGARDSRWWVAAIAGVLLAGLGLRLWAIGHGLPFVFNIDERAHFVSRAAGMYGGDRNPHDFLNPAALMYAFYALLAVWFGGTQDAARAYAGDPTAVFTVARVAVALVGTLSIWLVYLAGARLLDRRAALLAAALMAVAYLPVFYSKQAVNDVPAMAALAFALWASAGVLRAGRLRDYALAGVGAGLAMGTKYTAVVVVLSLLAAAALRLRAEPRRVAGGVALGLGLAAVTFLATNPYAVLDHHAFLRDLKAQNDYTNGGLLLGERNRSGVSYYLWSLTWGLGWVPALSALPGALVLAWRNRPVAAVLVPTPVIFLLFMGLHGRYFGRYLLPLYPFACLLAGAGAAFLIAAIARRRPALAPVALAAAALALLVQPALHSAHGSIVDARTDTRTLARDWMRAHLPAGARVVQEPIVPREWLLAGGRAARAPPWGRWERSPPPARRRPAVATLEAQSRPRAAARPRVPARAAALGLPELRQDAVARPDRRVRADGLLLGGQRVAAVGPRPARPRAGAARGRLLWSAAPPGPRRLRG